MTDYRLVLTTAGSQEEAQKIAHALVQRQLAACVNIVPGIHSVYRWQGKVEEAQELLLLIKTKASAIDRVCSAIKQLHSYEVPEAVVIGIEAGSSAYLSWVAASVSD